MLSISLYLLLATYLMRHLEADMYVGNGSIR